MVDHVSDDPSTMKCGLFTSDAAAIAAKVGAVNRESDSLRSLAVRVHNVDIVDGDIVGLDAHASSLVVSKTIGLREAIGNSSPVAGIGRRVGRVSIDGKMRLQGRDDDLLLEGAFANED